MSAAFTIQVCGWLLGVPLEFLVVAALLRGQYRRFPFVFAHATVNLITTLVIIPADVTSALHPHDALSLQHFARVYWLSEGLLQVLNLAVVISLIDMAATHVRSRRLARVGLIAGAMLFAGLSFAVHYRPGMRFFGYWMTPFTRDLYFGSAILDLGLWAILISSRGRDRTVLLISGALGLQFTGAAIGEALQNLSIARTLHSLSMAGSVITMLAGLACLYIWWRTFRSAPAVQSAR